MQVDGHIECVHPGPKVPSCGLVEVLGGVYVANVRIAIDHRPLEAELRDGAIQLVNSGAFVLERRSSEAEPAMSTGDSRGAELHGAEYRLRLPSLRRLPTGDPISFIDTDTTEP
jgi:hypothetical protein